MDDMVPTKVERDETPVLFVRAPAGADGMRLAWERLEAQVGSLRGRRFFGAFDAATSEYRACVQASQGDDAEELGLERGILPGGCYLRARLRGEPPGVYDRIGPTFEALVRRAPPDETRPSIEFYRRRDEIDLLLPIAAS